MKIRFPKPLTAGDHIAVIAPSSGVPAAMHGQLENALCMLRNRGFQVTEGITLRRQVKGASAGPAERAQEWMDMLLDRRIAAVIPPWGGERAIELLHHIDFGKLKQAEPKIFSGFSDLSTLQVPLLLQSGWASVHGPNLMQLADPDLDRTTAYVFEAWQSGPGASMVQAASATGVARRLDGRGEPMQMSGRLVGGCVDAISRLAGSTLGAISRFVQSHRDTGVIVFLENAELRPFELARALHGLRLAGWFDGVAGVLMGRNAVTHSGGASDFTSRDALESVFHGMHCPVLVDVDIGHVSPQWSIVQGANATLHWTASSCMLTQSLV